MMSRVEMVSIKCKETDDEKKAAIAKMREDFEELFKEHPTDEYERNELRMKVSKTEAHLWYHRGYKAGMDYLKNAFLAEVTREDS